MSTAPIWRLFSAKCVTQNAVTPSCLSCSVRSYADSSKAGSTSKLIVTQGTDNVEQLRVRRARSSDVPRVLRFVRENVRVAWPALVSPSPSSHIVLGDYVTRALAQGHSMLAEQLETRRGWSQIRGLALGLSVCPWDAAMLESWARCIKCTRSRKLINFTAHCLRAPGLHEKYKVHNILQVILIVSPDVTKNAKIVNVLAKNVIQKGREKGFPLIRFDISDHLVLNSLEKLNLKKEWDLSYYDINPQMKDKPSPIEKKSRNLDIDTSMSEKHVTVCTVPNP